MQVLVTISTFCAVAVTEMTERVIVPRVAQRLVFLMGLLLAVKWCIQVPTSDSRICSTTLFGCQVKVPMRILIFVMKFLYTNNRFRNRNRIRRSLLYGPAFGLWFSSLSDPSDEGGNSVKVGTRVDRCQTNKTSYPGEQINYGF